MAGYPDMGWEARQAGTHRPVPAPFPGLGGAWGPPHQLALVYKDSSIPRKFAASENLGRGPAGQVPRKGGWDSSGRSGPRWGWSLNGGVSLRGSALGRPHLPVLEEQTSCSCCEEFKSNKAQYLQNLLKKEKWSRQAVGSWGSWQMLPVAYSVWISLS